MLTTRSVGELMKPTITIDSVSVVKPGITKQQEMGARGAAVQAKMLLWWRMHEAAEHDPALRDAVERVKILYYLSNNDEQQL